MKESNTRDNCTQDPVFLFVTESITDYTGRQTTEVSLAMCVTISEHTNKNQKLGHWRQGPIRGILLQHWPPKQGEPIFILWSMRHGHTSKRAKKKWRLVQARLHNNGNRRLYTRSMNVCATYLTQFGSLNWQSLKFERILF